MGTPINRVKHVSLHISPPPQCRRTIPVFQIPKLSILVKKGRKKYRLTQAELAHRTGLTTAEISRIESESIQKPSREVLKALSPYTGVPYSDLLFYTGYSGNTDEPEYYDLSGRPVSCDDIINDIYSADADLLGLLKDIDSFTSYEDRELLKIILLLMRKTHKESEKNIALSSSKNIFTATKAFLTVHLKELLNNINLSNESI